MRWQHGIFADELKRLGITQAELSGALRVTPSTVSKWCIGSSEPRPKSRELLYAYMGDVARRRNMELIKERYLWGL